MKVVIGEANGFVGKGAPASVGEWFRFRRYVGSAAPY